MGVTPRNYLENFSKRGYHLLARTLRRYYPLRAWCAGMVSERYLDKKTDQKPWLKKKAVRRRCLYPGKGDFNMPDIIAPGIYQAVPKLLEASEFFFDEFEAAVSRLLPEGQRRTLEGAGCNKTGIDRLSMLEVIHMRAGHALEEILNNDDQGARVLAERAVIAVLDAAFEICGKVQEGEKQKEMTDDIGAPANPPAFSSELVC